MALWPLVEQAPVGSGISRPLWTLAGFLDRLTPCADFSDRALDDADARVLGDFDLNLILVLDLRDLANDAARGDHRIAAPDVAHHLSMLLGTLLLGAEQQEVEDHEHQQDGDQLHKEVAAADRGALCESRRNEHEPFSPRLRRSKHRRTLRSRPAPQARTATNCRRDYSVPLPLCNNFGEMARVSKNRCRHPMERRCSTLIVMAANLSRAPRS